MPGIGAYYLDAVEADLLREIIRPETALESHILRQPEVVEGMAWGRPRFGHPEGEVYRHVAEVLTNVDKLERLGSIERVDLRLVTLLHDTFKFAEDKREPRDWSKHHGILARRFAEQYVKKPRVLELIEWHDEAYYCWRLDALYGKPSLSRQRLDALLHRFGDDMPFYYRFFVCDTRTGDKNQAPVKWVCEEAEMQGVPTW